MIERVLPLTLVVFLAAIFLQRLWIDTIRRLALGETIKQYGPSGHERKIGTPGMGGVVALALAAPVAAAIWMLGLAPPDELAGIWIYPMLCAAIGLLDDALKRRSRSSEGLRSLQKLFLQIAVTLPWALWASADGLWLTPEMSVGPFVGAPLLLFLGVGFMNAVNVTDGLDGLAAGMTACSLCAFLLIARGGAATASAAAGLALTLAFLWHNSNPAELFMGDVGAHFWAGLLLALCVSERMLMMIFPLGFLFGIEMITVTIQIIAIRRFKTKVFLMSPLHHHFELKGWGETRIVSRFWLAHIVGMTALAAAFMRVF